VRTKGGYTADGYLTPRAIYNVVAESAVAAGDLIQLELGLESGNRPSR
jgi:hypothetical protein